MVDENLSGDYLVIRRIGDYHPTFINIEKGRGWDPCRPRILNKAMGINIASVLDIIENYEKIYKYIDSCPFYEEAKIAYENNEPLKLVDVDGERYYPVKGLQEN
ncbi:MAG: hypothetical protein LBJ31_04240 [Treponema sp.]|jgi:hypothetical protein|nr:hypothetical protein [Treponema sp.]